MNNTIIKYLTIITKLNINKYYYFINEKFFKVEARSDDGIIEAISLNGYKFIFGVQWHPEDMNDIDQDKLFSYFVNIIWFFQDFMLTFK